MRSLVALLLCFILAFQGSAMAHGLRNSCPMKHDAMASVAVDGLVQAVPDCCNDPGTAAKTGKSCKTEIPCCASGACILPSSDVSISHAPTSDSVPSPKPRIASSALAAVWRPPSLG